jgi:hypothetical protein
MGWATLWAPFSQTRLVALLASSSVQCDLNRMECHKIGSLSLMHFVSLKLKKRFGVKHPKYYLQKWPHYASSPQGTYIQKVSFLSKDQVSLIRFFVGVISIEI